MHSLSILAAVAVKSSIWETFLDALPHVTGMFVVIITLTILWGVCALTGWLVKTLIPVSVAAPVNTVSTVAAAPRPASTEAGTSVPPEIVAVIAAAVHTAVGKGHKVVGIKPRDSNWEKAGRQSVLGSHRLR